MRPSILQTKWTAVIGIVAVVLATAGCSSSDEPPASKKPSVEKQQSSAPSRSASSKPIASSKMPAAEFQQSPVLPPNEPLPKPAERVSQAEELPPLQDVPPVRELPPLHDLPPKQELSQPPPKVAATEKIEVAATEKVGADATEKIGAAPKPAQPLSTGKHSGQKFDPIAINGEIFKDKGKDWPKPKVAIVITGVEDGYLEPCGCAGLDWMKGGMSRRHTFFLEQRKKGWPLVALDVGGLARNFGRQRQAEMKFHTLVESKLKMEYDAIGFGVEDLRLPTIELISVAAAIEDKPSPFLSANVGLLGFESKITQTSRIIEAGGLKIGVTAVLGKQYQKEINNPEIEMIDPETALARIAPELKRNSNFRVLLSYATMKETIQLAKKFPEFNVVVCSDCPEVPPKEYEMIEGTKTMLITVGHKGMYLIVLGLFDSEPRIRYQRVPLDSRFAASPEMKMLMASYQDLLKETGFSELLKHPPQHPLAENNGQFVGSKKCQSCHEESYDVWKKSKHAKAYDTLAKLDPPRNFDPECVSCHVVGWHPTKFFPYQGGFESLEKTPHLIDTGCEGCHGPGEKHCAAELAGSEALKLKYRKAVVITKAESQKSQCVTCHDLDNSPDFKFESYYPLIEHHEEK